MKILNLQDKELSREDINLSKGYLVKERVFVAHHPGTPYTPPQYASEPQVVYFTDGTHYVITGADDPHLDKNHSFRLLEDEQGKVVKGMNINMVLVKPAMEEVPARDEYDIILRYHPYSQQQLNTIAADEARKKAALTFLDTGEAQLKEVIARIEKQAKTIEDLAVMVSTMSFGNFDEEEEEVEESKEEQPLHNTKAAETEEETLETPALADEVDRADGTDEAEEDDSELSVDE